MLKKGLCLSCILKLLQYSPALVILSDSEGSLLEIPRASE